MMSQPLQFDDPVKGNSDVKIVLEGLKKELGSYWKL
jgi:hypothetical protein